MGSQDRDRWFWRKREITGFAKPKLSWSLIWQGALRTSNEKYQPQKGDYWKCQPTSEWHRGFDDRKHGACWGVHIFSILSFLLTIRSQVHGTCVEYRRLIHPQERKIEEHKLDMQNSMGAGGVHPWVFRELANVFVKATLHYPWRNVVLGRKKMSFLPSGRARRIQGTTVWLSSTWSLWEWGIKQLRKSPPDIWRKRRW